MFYDPLYKIDSKGKVRVWYIEVEDNAYRAISGIHNGKLVTAGWKYAKGKNTGKKNETLDAEQAILEVESIYTKKLEKDYYLNIDDAGTSRFFVPMTAKKWSDLTIEKILNYFEIYKRLYSQPKLDGVRCVADKDGLRTRGGKEIVSCPHIIEELKPFFDKYPDKRLDGELYNHKYRKDFNTLISVIKKTKPTPNDLVESENVVQYHIYDMPSDDIFSDRYALMEDYDELQTSSIYLVKTTSHESIEELEHEYAEYLRLEYEGQMVRIDEIYESKRSNFLWKNKLFFDAEFEIVSINEGTGHWAGKAKSATMRADNGNLFDAGIKGTAEEMAALLLMEEELLRNKAKATVRYQNLTPDREVPRIGIVHVIHNSERW